LNGSVGHA